MMCLLNVYLVCILAAECKKVGCEKRSAYTLSFSCFAPHSRGQYNEWGLDIKNVIWFMFK